MRQGFQKPALIAYVALCIFLLSRPSPMRLADRAQRLDQTLTSQGAPLAAALAAALEMPIEKVQTRLSYPDSKPSDVVFDKLLEKTGAKAEKETPAEAVVRAGMPVDDAIAYFNSIEKLVIQNLAKDEKVEAVARPGADSRDPALAHSLRSTSD